MKALVYRGVERLDYLEVPDPEPRPGEMLVEVDSVGICGSDMHAYLGHDERRMPPLILGHEAAGIVRGGPRDGARVTVNPLVACGRCEACAAGRDNLCPNRQIISMPPREGAFCRYISMPERNLVAVPDGVTLEQAALAEPIACGWHGVRLTLDVLRGRSGSLSALVLGGGAIGLGAALCLGNRGVEDVTLSEPNAARRAFLERSCGQRVAAPEALAADTMFDIVVDAVGYEASRRTASLHAKPGGVILHIGLGSAEGGLNVRRMTLQEITFIGTYTYTAEDFRATADAMFSGALGALDWVEPRALSEGAEAFTAIREGRVAAPKIMLKTV